MIVNLISDGDKIFILTEDLSGGYFSSTELIELNQVRTASSSDTKHIKTTLSRVGKKINTLNEYKNKLTWIKTVYDIGAKQTFLEKTGTRKRITTNISLDQLYKLISGLNPEFNAAYNGFQLICKGPAKFGDIVLFLRGGEKNISDVGGKLMIFLI